MLAVSVKNLLFQVVKVTIGKPTDMLDVMPRLKDDDPVKQRINIAEFVQAELFSLGLSASFSKID